MALPHAQVFAALDRATRRRVVRVSAATTVGAGAMVWAGLLGLLVGKPGSLHLALALAILPLALAVVSASPRTTLVGLALWLVALGMVRRFVGNGGASTGGFGDPLLLVAPAVLVLLVLVAARYGAFRGRTRLANAVGLLSLLALVEAANPLQGGLTVGLGGLLFVLVPMLAFWVGRAFVDDQLLARVFRLVGSLSVLSAIYGIVQQFAGFPSWDQRWIATSGLVSLDVNGVTRAFANFTSSQEYAVFLSLGLVVLIAHLQGARRLLFGVRIAAIALVATALVLSSVRGSIVLAVVGLGALAGARVGLRATSAVVATGLALVILSIALGHLGTSSSTSSKASSSGALLQHDLAGLSSPTGKSSTLPGHFDRIAAGVKQGFIEPLGEGTGSVTIAASRLGSVQNLGTEGDLGNAGVALGIAGLVLYATVLVRAMGATYRNAARRRDRLALAALGVLIVAADQWLNGDLYSVAWLVWLCLGWIDRQALQPEREPPGLAAAGQAGAP